MEICIIPECVNERDLKKLYYSSYFILEKERQENVVRNIHDVSEYICPNIIQRLEKKLHKRYPKELEGMHINLESALIINAGPNGTVSQYWHRDTEHPAFTVIIPFVDIHKENGCIQIIPESMHTEPRNWQRNLKNSVFTECRKGDIILFDSRLLHRGLKNTTNEDRPVLALDVSAYPARWTAT